MLIKSYSLFKSLKLLIVVCILLAILLILNKTTDQKISKNTHKKYYNSIFKNRSTSDEDLSDYYVREYIEFEAETCSPFFENINQYNVSINGTTYPRITPEYLNKSINFECLNKNLKPKIILFWNERWGLKDFGYGLGFQRPFHQNLCPVYNCETTNDKSRLNESHILIFHMGDRLGTLPQWRNPDQRWIFYMYESPANSLHFKNLDGVFNLSATYRKSSNFSSRYYVSSMMWWEENLNFNVSKDFQEGKTDFAAAVISNCNARSDRLAYINELRKYINVTIYGRCGIKCPTIYENERQADCKKILSRRYLFFFAFENSFCDDYVTEKFFLMLRYDIIPVVLGRGNYDMYAPKSAYINALDYKTPKKLAEHLLHLSRNKEAYKAHFAWKKHVRFGPLPSFSDICEMCLQLNLDRYYPIKRSVINDLGNFWFKKRDCSDVARVDATGYYFKSF